MAECLEPRRDSATGVNPPGAVTDRNFSGHGSETNVWIIGTIPAPPRARPAARSGRCSSRRGRVTEPATASKAVQLQRTLPQRSRQHHWQRLRPQRSIQQRRQRTSVRSLLRLVITLLAGGTVNAADAVEKPAASKSPASPSAMTAFCMTRLSLSMRCVETITQVLHRARSCGRQRRVGTMDRSPRRPMPSSPPCSWASTTQLQGHCGGSGTVSRCASHACPQGVAPATRTVGPKAAL